VGTNTFTLHSRVSGSVRNAILWSAEQRGRYVFESHLVSQFRTSFTRDGESHWMITERYDGAFRNQVPASNLGWETYCPNCGLPCFTSVV